ncbi:MAG TPA: hypothetical protein VL284_06870 [Thermoanaerobaculia bacterium]|nr:hypothetical protein [Thermoanaerobaculia bacterium]
MTEIAFVIPTRHRARLACEAIQALLPQMTAGAVQLFVSDNSANDADVRELRDFCSALGSSAVVYLRPPESLSMGTHWNWALEQAMARSNATHFGIHYDRKLVKPHAAARLVACADRHPDLLIVYPCDFTHRVENGFVAWQFPVSGREYLMRTSLVIERSASGAITEMGQTWPVLSNCIVPRAVFDRIRARFGSICDSFTPDGSFAYRFCATDDRYLFLDKAIQVMRAFSLSNGLAYYRRDSGGTFGDFTRLWGDRPWLDAAPIPGLTLGNNCIFHEYTLVQRVAGRHRFPPVDHAGYLREIALGLRYIADLDERAALRAMLEERGWREETQTPNPPPLLSRIRRRAVRALPRILRQAVRKMRPPRDPVFPTEEEAVQYLLEHERRPVKHNTLLDVMQPQAASYEKANQAVSRRSDRSAATRSSR